MTLSELQPVPHAETVSSATMAARSGLCSQLTTDCPDDSQQKGLSVSTHSTKKQTKVYAFPPTYNQKTQVCEKLALDDPEDRVKRMKYTQEDCAQMHYKSAASEVDILDMV